MKIILLAAGVGRRFGRRTKKLPKCLIPIGRRGENLLSRALNSFLQLGLRNVVIVVGHQKEKIVRECAKKGRGLSVHFIVNSAYKKGSIVSLHAASGELGENCLIMDADVFFPTQALKRLVNSKHHSAFLIDPRSRSTGEEMMLMAPASAGERRSGPCRIAKKTDPSLKILGEATGFFKIGKENGNILQKKAQTRGGSFQQHHSERYPIQKVAQT